MKKSLYLTLFLLPLVALPVYADDDDDSGVFMKNLLTKAGIVGDKKEIKYQERPPLVLPPSVTGKGSAALPAPSNSAASQSKSWPVDPDTEKAKREELRAKKPTNVHYNASRALTPEELNRGRVAGAGAPTLNTQTQVANPTVGIGGLFNFKKDEEARIDFKGEAPRTSLIQPPAGYRTPSANQPYGPVGKTDYNVLEIDPKTGKPK